MLKNLAFHVLGYEAHHKRFTGDRISFSVLILITGFSRRNLSEQ